MRSKWFDMILGEENSAEFPLHTTGEKLLGVEHAMDLKIGRRCDTWDPQSILFSAKSENDGTPEELLANTLHLPVFSKSLREALGDIGIQDIQYLPIRVARSTGDEIPGYEVANILTRLPALDREHTKLLMEKKEEIDPLTGRAKVTGMWRAALKGVMLEGHDIIRLVEFWPLVCVSERFVNVFTKHRFHGATFKPLELY